MIRMDLSTCQKGFKSKRSEQQNKHFTNCFIACKSSIVARDLLERIDPAVDPCEDFYDFACGNYVNNNVMPPDRIWKATFTDDDDMNNRRIAGTAELQWLEHW